VLRRQEFELFTVQGRGAAAVAQIEKVSVISDEMRAVVESKWPELAHKLPLAKPQR